MMDWMMNDGSWEMRKGEGREGMNEIVFFWPPEDENKKFGSCFSFSFSSFRAARRQRGRAARRPHGREKGHP